MITEKMTLVFPGAGQPIGGGMLTCENDTMIVTVGGFGRHEPSADSADMIAAATHFAPPSVLAALRAGTPLGEVSVYRYPGSVWRRYDKMRRFPAGLLVFGDAIASLNPAFGQGMAVAALEAVMLKDCLAGGDADLARRFFAAAAKQLTTVWQRNRITEGLFSSRQVQRRRGRSVLRRLQRRLMNWWMHKVMTAAENDIFITETFFRVQNLVAPPTKLWHPRFLVRVVGANRRASAVKRIHQPDSTSVFTQA